MILLSYSLIFMVGVISGDIINSSLLASREREKLYTGLENFLKGLGRKDKLFKAETGKGDYFQCLILNPVSALRYALLIKTFLRSLDMDRGGEESKKGIHDARMAIGVGEADFLKPRLGSSDGAAFRLSGRLLEKMKKTGNTLEAAMEGPEDVNDELAVMLHLMDFIFSKTTALQCEVIHRKLSGKKETEIAEELKILQSAVNQRSTASGWNALESGVKRFETIISKING